MAVPLADAAVTPVDKQLGILVPSDFSSPIDGFLLGLMDRRRPLAALRLDRPPIRVGNNVLVSVRHVICSFLVAPSLRLAKLQP